MTNFAGVNFEKKKRRGNGGEKLRVQTECWTENQSSLDLGPMNDP